MKHDFFKVMSNFTAKLLIFIRFGVKLNGEQYNGILVKCAFFRLAVICIVPSRIDDFASHTISGKKKAPSVRTMP